MLLQNPYVPFKNNDNFTDVQFTNAMGSNTPIPSRILAYKLCARNTLDCPFPFYPGAHYVPDFPKKTMDAKMYTHQNTAQPVSVCHRYVLGPGVSAAFLDVVHLWLFLCICIVK